MIGKTRQQNAGQSTDFNAQSRTVFGQGCGVLRHSPTPGSFQHLRYAPSSALAGWVQHFWIESWDLRGSDSQTREVLPHPNVQFAFARGRSRIYGIQLRRFVRELKGADRIMGITFRAGAFYPFLRAPVFSIANASIPAQQVFGNVAEAEQEILSCSDDRQMVDAASRFLLANLPAHDPVVETACWAVKQIAADPAITRVQHLASRCGIHHRTLQRIFTRYVGASPLSVIKRYRVYDALEQLTHGKRFEWATLAQDLGYFDQAHFINDFKKMVGRSPTAYLEI